MSNKAEEGAKTFSLFIRLLVAVWAGTVWGWLWGIAVFLGLIIAIALTGHFLTLRSASGRAYRINRWAWVIAVVALIIASTASIESVG